jgi:hypothetical protein
MLCALPTHEARGQVARLVSAAGSQLPQPTAAEQWLHPTPWLEYLSEKSLYNPVLPPVFRSFTPLLADQFTTPVAGQRFVTVGPVAANGCE